MCLPQRREVFGHSALVFGPAGFYPNSDIRKCRFSHPLHWNNSPGHGIVVFLYTTIFISMFLTLASIFMCENSHVLFLFALLDFDTKVFLAFGNDLWLFSIV